MEILIQGSWVNECVSRIVYIWFSISFTQTSLFPVPISAIWYWIVICVFNFVWPLFCSEPNSTQVEDWSWLVTYQAYYVELSYLQCLCSHADYTYCLTWDLSCGSIWLVFFLFPKVYVCRGKDFSLEGKSVQTDVIGEWNLELFEL